MIYIRKRSFFRNKYNTKIQNLATQLTACSQFFVHPQRSKEPTKKKKNWSGPHQFFLFFNFRLTISVELLIHVRAKRFFILGTPARSTLKEKKRSNCVAARMIERTRRSIDLSIAKSALGKTRASCVYKTRFCIHVWRQNDDAENVVGTQYRSTSMFSDRAERSRRYNHHYRAREPLENYNVYTCCCCFSTAQVGGRETGIYLKRVFYLVTRSIFAIELTAQESFNVHKPRARFLLSATAIAECLYEQRAIARIYVRIRKKCWRGEVLEKKKQGRGGAGAAALINPAH